jgi:hypothetical protein
LGHAACARNVANGGGYQLGVSILECRFKVRGNILGGVEVFCGIPGACFYGHRLVLQLTRELLCEADVVILTVFISAA